MTTSNGSLFPVWSPDGKKIIGADVKCVMFDLSRPWPVHGEEIPQFEKRTFSPRSWSPDGKWLAGGTTGSDGVIEDLVLYSLETRTFEKIADTAAGGTFRPASWLNDSKRIIFQNGNQVFLTDRITKELHAINVNAGTSEITSIHISKDNKTLYFIRGKYESDIWQMNMK
jgi:Tol biopolymer transport system component